MSDKKHWITKLVPALAFAAGIIIASVGGIMTTSSSLKLAMFDSGPYSYISEDQCMYKYQGSVPTLMPLDGFDSNGNGLDLDVNSSVNTEAEIKSCVEKRQKEERSRFQKNQQENIIDGVSALIVGGVLLLAFRRRR